jgi:hypothetical protein
MPATPACSFADNKALYHYRCTDPDTSKVTHGTLPWCSLETAPYSDALLDAVKTYAFRDMNPSRSTTTTDSASLECDIFGTEVSTIERDFEARKVAIRRGFARSCAPVYSANEAAVRNDYTCHYSGGVTDDQGRRGSHPHRVTRGTLFSCDAGIGVSDELMQDVKLSAYLRAGGDAAELELSAFACDVTSLPLH